MVKSTLDELPLRKRSDHVSHSAMLIGFRAEDDVLYLIGEPIGEPDCWGADDSSVLHSLFQFFAFDEGLCGFDGGKFVGHCDFVGVSTAWYTA